MPETPDCWEVLADKIQDWIDSAHVPPKLGSTMEGYCEVAKIIRRNLPPSYERHVALRKLLDSQNWAGRILSCNSVSDRHKQDMDSIALHMSVPRVPKNVMGIFARYWSLFTEITIAHDFDGTFEHVQAARLLLESRDAAVRACLDMLAEQQKQELRAVSQSE
jgi:hypothetical protein